MIILLGVEGKAAMQLEKQREKVKEILYWRFCKIRRERERETKLERTARPLPLQEVYL